MHRPIKIEDFLEEKYNFSPSPKNGHPFFIPNSFHNSMKSMHDPISHDNFLLSIPLQTDGRTDGQTDKG